MKRNIVTAIILSIITCGIYNLYWIYALNNDASRLAREDEDGGMVLILSLITCGIYFLIWNYKMGDKIYQAGGKNDQVVYLILAIFGLSIVSMALMQTEVNNLLDQRGPAY